MLGRLDRVRGGHRANDRDRRKKGLERAGFAEGSGLAAEMFAGVDDEGMKLVEKPVIGREVAFEEGAKVIIGIARGSEPVALEDAAGVSVNDEDGVVASI